MSTFTAIAGVSSTLRNLLKDRMEQVVPITIAPPDINVAGVSTKRLNLYLYQVNQSATLRNQDFPSGSPGSYGRPPLSLELYYLITAFGGTETAADADLQAQIMLGDALRALHEYPIVTGSLREGDLPGGALILDASLAGAVENLRFTMHPATTDELTKVWTALPAAQFRRSVIYLATVVQIESRKQRRPGLPVRAVNPVAQTFHVPSLDAVTRSPPFAGLPAGLAEVGDTVRLTGNDLSAAVVKVKFGLVLVDPLTITDDALTAVIPATAGAGVVPVSVIHGPPASETAVQSSVAPLAVAPQVVSVLPASAAAGVTVTVTVNPAVASTQDRRIILGDRMIDAIAVTPGSPPTTTIQFKMPSGSSAIPAGAQLLRVRVDGVDSRLTVNPNNGQYTGPILTAT